VSIKECRKTKKKIAVLDVDSGFIVSQNSDVRGMQRDVIGNHCLQFRCSGENGLMDDDNCSVIWVPDCNSGVARFWHHLFVKLSWGGSKCLVVAQNTTRGASFATSTEMECVPVAATVGQSLFVAL
jgi:hypothetical protein